MNGILKDFSIFNLLKALRRLISALSMHYLPEEEKQMFMSEAPMQAELRIKIVY